MPDDMKTQAAAYVDAEFRRTQDDLFREHRRQEQRQLAWHNSARQSFARNRELSEQRYLQRLKSIEERRDRIAERLQRQHRSIGGRLEALTKKGRDRQADILARLDDRAAALTARATRQFEERKERQFEAEQRERIHDARHVKFIRLDHLELRQQQARHHEETRERTIDDRVQAMRQTAERNLRQECSACTVRTSSRQEADHPALDRQGRFPGLGEASDGGGCVVAPEAQTPFLAPEIEKEGHF